MYVQLLSLALFFLLWNTINGCHTFPGFVRVDKGCYYFSKEASTWVEAMIQCGKMNSELISIETVEESFAINLHIYRAYGLNKVTYWTSGSDIFSEGKFIWLAKGKLVNYSNWCQDEPNNFGGKEHCLHLTHGYPLVGNTCWNDYPCSNIVIHFICEV